MSSGSVIQSQRGAFIVLEGLDRSGKTTQYRSEPKTGPIIDAFLREAKSPFDDGEAVHLLFSANRWLLDPKMRADLARGVNLITDRYSFSGVAYSLAKGLDKTWSCTPEVGLLKPDIVIFLDAKPAATTARCGFGGEVLERSDFQKSVYRHMKAVYSEVYWQ
ncbi:thymidylate kinase-like isoform X3, partial [Aphelenchoides avenae]